MSQASYDLARLRGNGLIERIGRTNTYRLTADGRSSPWSTAASMTRCCIPSPPTTSRSPLPAPVRAAWRTITRHIDSTVAATRLGRAA